MVRMCLSSHELNEPIVIFMEGGGARGLERPLIS